MAWAKEDVEELCAYLVAMNKMSGHVTDNWKKWLEVVCELWGYYCGHQIDRGFGDPGLLDLESIRRK